jgi:hypothetical protein
VTTTSATKVPDFPGIYQIQAEQRDETIHWLAKIEGDTDNVDVCNKEELIQSLKMKQNLVCNAWNRDVSNFNKHFDEVKS